MRKELNKKLFFVLIVVAVMFAVLVSMTLNPSLSPFSSLGKNSEGLNEIRGDVKGGVLRGGTEPVMCYVCDVVALLPPTFTGCYGDADGNGFVNAGDRGYVATNIGQTENDLVCKFDMDGNGFINAGDRGYVATNIGLCEPLPDYQDGNGVNGWVYDPRFDDISCCGNRVCEESNGENSENCLVDCGEDEPVCEDGTIEGDEQCEGSNLNSQTCTSLELGYSGGELGCYPEGVIGECNFDFSGCNRCGDGITQTEDGEECDDGNILNGDGCSASCTDESCDILEEEFSQIVLATENVVENSVRSFSVNEYLDNIPDGTIFTWVVKDPQSNFYFDATTTHGLRCDHLGGESDDDNGRNVDYTFEHIGTNQQLILVAEHPGCEEQRAVVKTLNVARNTALPLRAGFKVYELVDSAKDSECKGDWREVNPATHTFEEGERIRFSGSASTGDIFWYSWQFMDGSGGGHEDMIRVFGGSSPVSGEFDVQFTVYKQNGPSSRTTMKKINCENLGGTYSTTTQVCTVNGEVVPVSGVVVGGMSTLGDMTSVWSNFRPYRTAIASDRIWGVSTSSKLGVSDLRFTQGLTPTYQSQDVLENSEPITYVLAGDDFIVVRISGHLEIYTVPESLIPPYVSGGPAVISSGMLNGATVGGGFIVNDYLYVLTSSPSEIWVFDLSNPLQPTYVNHVSSPSIQTFSSEQVADSVFAVLSSLNDGIFLIDCRIPDEPVISSLFALPNVGNDLTGNVMEKKLAAKNGAVLGGRSIFDVYAPEDTNYPVRLDYLGIFPHFAHQMTFVDNRIIFKNDRYIDKSSIDDLSDPYLLERYSVDGLGVTALDTYYPNDGEPIIIAGMYSGIGYSAVSP